eukprot:8844965-Ditylum_brightwellii.AAC.1
MAFVYPDKPDTLAICVDDAHANDLKTRKSVEAYVVTLGEAVVAYRSKLQPNISISSTEVEFIAAVPVAKIVEYL